MESHVNLHSHAGAHYIAFAVTFPMSHVGQSIAERACCFEVYGQRVRARFEMA